MRREPTVILRSIEALLGVLVAFGLPFLSAIQAASIIAVLAVVASILNAWKVHQIAPPLFTGLVTAIAALLAAYGFDFTQQQVGAVQVLVLSVLTLLTRVQVDPVEAPPTMAADH